MFFWTVCIELVLELHREPFCELLHRERRLNISTLYRDASRYELLRTLS